RQSSQGKADPDQRRHSSVCARRAKDRETESCSRHQDSLANSVSTIAVSDKSIHHPSAHQQVRESGEQPGYAGIENRVEQIHVKRNGKIAGQPRQKEKKSVIVGTPSQR